MNDESNHSYIVHSNTLYILESLVNEQKTGKWLYEDLYPLTIKHEIYSIEYCSIESKSQLFSQFEKIKLEIEENLRLPTIHLEAHGNTLGFEIAHSKEFVSWSELNDKLSEINLLCRNNLILSLGICNGHFINLDLVKRLENNKRCPFLVNISPQDKISPQEIKLGYSNFYNSLFESRDFYIAMQSMKEETILNFLLTADTVLKETVKFLNNISNDRDFTFKSSIQLQELIAKGENPFPARNYNQSLKAFKRYKKRYYKEDLEKKWNHFLMIDSFEENRDRFESFEKVWK